MSRAVPVHYLRPNHAEWSPPSVIALDTETRWHMDGDDEVHELRLWCARFTDRRSQRKKDCVTDEAYGFSQHDIALQVHQWCQKRRTVWLYAHNLTFDLMTTSLIERLSEMGWEVTDFAVDGAAPFCRLARGNCCLTVCDSWSWLPASIANIGIACGLDKPALPGNDDSDDAWLIRCQADTEILSTAVLTLMEWWDREKLGRWTVTGAACGWNAMRHKPTPDRILIRPDVTEVKDDRKAVYGGRRFAWRTGELPRGRFAELDIERAYTTACRDLPLPVQRMARFAGLPLEHRWLDCERHGVIADCLIETSSPRYPCRSDGRVWYPTGVFRTTLAGPDIRSARDRGELREVGAGWVHELGYALRPWAVWCTDSQADDAPGVPDVAKIALRGWGRSVVGKWAQRGYERIRLGPSPVTGWCHEEGWDHAEGVKASIVDFGGTRWQVSATAEADNSYPAILAFVESYVRVALSAAIDAIGEKSLVSCDTDGMIMDCVTAMGQRARTIARLANDGTHADPIGGIIASAARRAEPFRLRDKKTYHRVTVLGPQHLIADDSRRMAGIPGSAEPMPDGRLHAWLWPKLAWQMQHGRPGQYRRPSTHYRLAAVYAPGWVLADGSVRPVEIRPGADGSNRLLPWPLTALARSGAQLGPCQGKRLERYRDAEKDTHAGQANADRAPRRPPRGPRDVPAAQSGLRSVHQSAGKSVRALR